MHIFNFHKAALPRYTSEEWISVFEKKGDVVFSDDLKDVLKSMKIHERTSSVDLEAYVSQDKTTTTKPPLKYYEEAIAKSLKAAALDYHDVNGIVFSTNTPDYSAPGMSSLLMASMPFQRDMKHYSLTGMGCGGSIVHLQFMKDMVKAYPNTLWLACVGEFPHPFLPSMDYFRGQKIFSFSEIMSMDIPSEEKEKRLTQTNLFLQTYLFGDAAVCYWVAGDQWWAEHASSLHMNSAQLERFGMLTNLSSEDSKAIYFKDGSAAHPEVIKKRIQYYMGKNVPSLVENYMKEILKEVSPREWDRILLHTGSHKIIQKAVQVGGWSEDKIALSYNILSRFGNVSQGSIPLMWDHLSRELSQEETKVLSLSFGLGFIGSFAEMTFTRRS